MIFYFSATGNSKYVATRLAKQLNETIVSISDCFQTNKFSFDLKDDEQIGFVTPTYFFGLPTIVNEFLDRLEISKTKKAYVFHIATFGTTTGQTGKMMNELLLKKGLHLDGKFSVKMVDTWTPTFNLTNKDKLSKINKNAEEEIDYVCNQIKNKNVGDYSHNKIPLFMVNMYYPTYDKKRKTENFHLEDTCIGCGICAKKCPVKAIKMHNSKPIWVKDECTLCLGCLHRCPRFSIQYGKNTKKHGQFTNPNVKI